jgi:RHS repeat-associated protein
MEMPNRNFTAGGNDYRYGFNGKEKDDEIKGEANSLDFGVRMYDPRTGRWNTLDRYSAKYPGDSPFSFALNTPISAVDPDGNLIIFIGGLRLSERDRDQAGSKHAGERGGMTGIYNYDATGYWCEDKNSFGRQADIAGKFKERIQDDNAWFTSGSSRWRSQPEDRKKEGMAKAEMFHAMVQSGEIKLEAGETIKIVSHSQGGAHAEGFAEQLLSYKDANGEPIYKIEVVYNITPHQPEGIEKPAGVERSVQYSHPNDAISSDDPLWLPNGKSNIAPIKGVDEYDARDVLGGKGQPKAEGPAGNRGGHNVTDNDFIFDIKPGEAGYVAPRKDMPEQCDDSCD